MTKISICALCLTGCLCLSLVTAVAYAQDNVPTHSVGAQYIREWLVLGPFFHEDLENDFLSHLGGETSFEPVEGLSVATADGKTLRWKRHAATDNLVDLLDAVGNYDGVTAYAFCFLYSEGGEKAEIFFDHDDGGKLWINGQQVYRNPSTTISSMSGGGGFEHMGYNPNLRLEINLKPGFNSCLVKVSQGVLDWGFKMRVMPPNQAAVISGTALTKPEMAFTV